MMHRVPQNNFTNVGVIFCRSAANKTSTCLRMKAGNAGLGLKASIPHSSKSGAETLHQQRFGYKTRNIFAK